MTAELSRFFAFEVHLQVLLVHLVGVPRLWTVEYVI